MDLGEPDRGSGRAAMMCALLVSQTVAYAVLHHIPALVEAPNFNYTTLEPDGNRVLDMSAEDRFEHMSNNVGKRTVLVFAKLRQCTRDDQVIRQCAPHYKRDTAGQ